MPVSPYLFIYFSHIIETFDGLLHYLKRTHLDPLAQSLTVAPHQHCNGNQLWHPAVAEICLTKDGAKGSNLCQTSVKKKKKIKKGANPGLITPPSSFGSSGKFRGQKDIFITGNSDSFSFIFIKIKTRPFLFFQFKGISVSQTFPYREKECCWWQRGGWIFVLNALIFYRAEKCKAQSSNQWNNTIFSKSKDLDAEAESKLSQYFFSSPFPLETLRRVGERFLIHAIIIINARYQVE